MHTVAAEVTPAVENPATHVSQLVWPVLPWYRPLSHDVQLAAPVALCAVPSAQLSHSLLPVSPAYLPAAQAVQFTATLPL